MITHALSFADEAAAKVALPDYWAATDDGWDWRRDIVDGPIPHAGDAYLLNIAMQALDPDMPGLTGAWDQVKPDGTVDLIWGTIPVTPQRVFA